MAQRKVKFRGFVSVSLNKQEKQHVKGNPMDSEKALDFVVDACELGYKVSQSFSQDGEFYTVTLYGNHPDNPNAGYAMSIRHRDLLISFSALAHVLREEGLSTDWGERFTLPGDDDW